MRLQKAIWVEYLSSAWMSIEVFVALVSGLIAGSLALLAFGGDSVVELISGLVVLTRLRNHSTDSEEHVAGLEKTEKITTGLLFSLLPVIGIAALYSFFSGLRPEKSLFGISIALGAVLVMPWLYFQKKRIGDETSTPILKIDAVESATCFFMSVALLGGLLTEYFLGLWWVDYLATGIILVFVAREALESYGGLRQE